MKMNILNVATYLTERKRFNFSEHTIEGIEFNLIPLTDDMIQEFKIDNETYEDMLSSAATYGVSVGRNRVCNDEEMAADLEGMWALDQFADCEPSLLHKVGEKVCAISGLTEFIEDQRKLEEDLAEEEAKKLEVGDHMIPADIDVDELAEKAGDYKIAS
tara:strand:- start:955 stop:1431 length:477 start_codon:yes stop_codon:yes gene_type:complete